MLQNHTSIATVGKSAKGGLNCGLNQLKLVQKKQVFASFCHFKL